MKIVAISDTHNKHKQVTIPSCDLLIHAGDFSGMGRIAEVQSFLGWFEAQPATHKVFIAGNHDFLFEGESTLAQSISADYGFNVEGTNKHYLQDSFVIIGGVKIYGSPWQPWFHDWAFNIRNRRDLERKWSQIPEDTDILVTHGPPLGVGDRTYSGKAVGCEDLLNRVMETKVKIHMFGHIHEAQGHYRLSGRDFYNLSICDLQYRPINMPLEIEI